MFGSGIIVIMSCLLCGPSFGGLLTVRDKDNMGTSQVWDAGKKIELVLVSTVLLKMAKWR